MTAPRNQFRANLRRLRRARGHTQAQLDLLVWASGDGSRTRRYEAGASWPSDTTLLALAAALRVDWWALLEADHRSE